MKCGTPIYFRVFSDGSVDKAQNEYPPTTETGWMRVTHFDYAHGNADKSDDVILLSQILEELQSIRYRLDGELYVNVNNAEDCR